MASCRCRDEGAGVAERLGAGVNGVGNHLDTDGLFEADGWGGVILCRFAA